MNLFALFAAACFLAFLMGALVPVMLSFAKRQGKTAIFRVGSASGEITQTWGKLRGRKIVDKRNELLSPMSSEYRLQFKGRPAHLYNADNGSPLRVGEQGTFEGLDGRAWYRIIRDQRVSDIQNGPRQDLEAMMKYALMGLGLIVLLLLPIVFVVAKGAL